MYKAMKIRGQISKHVKSYKRWRAGLTTDESKISLPILQRCTKAVCEDHGIPIEQTNVLVQL